MYEQNEDQVKELSREQMQQVQGGIGIITAHLTCLTVKPEGKPAWSLSRDCIVD